MVGIQWRESQRIRLLVEGLGNEKEVQTEVGLSDSQWRSGYGPKYMNVWISDSNAYRNFIITEYVSIVQLLFFFSHWAYGA